MASEITRFDEFKLNRQLLNAVEDQDYDAPTEIQAKAIPRILAGQDVMGIAQTGTGKTAAFVLPVLMKVKYAQGDAPRALILAPTKELVLQIAEVVKSFSTYTDLRSVVLYGGVGPTAQINELEAGCDILVSTPGRFLELYGKGEIDSKSIRTLVLDEADRMMDMGFISQIRSILEVIPVKRQNLLFSATMPPTVVKLSEEFLEFPETIEVTPQATAAETVVQERYYTPNLASKINFLLHLLKNKDLSRVIVFTRTKSTADNIFKYLSRKEMGEIRVIHANKGQNTRINSINDFKAGEVRILVTTDVSSRGLDILDVSHVINFDVPVKHDDYVHRIGRTGRAFKTGESITFFNDAEKYHIHKIEKIISEKIPELPLPSEIEVPETPFDERQEMAREIDRQRRKEDPDYQGAFHEKKRKPGDKKKRRK